jgi:hypothetical protein
MSEANEENGRPSAFCDTATRSLVEKTDVLKMLTAIIIKEITWRNIPETSHFHTRRCDKLKAKKKMESFNVP